MSPIPDEPARGDYPEIELLGLTGADRMTVWAERMGPVAPMGRLTGVVYEDHTFNAASFSMPASPWLQTSCGLFPGAACLLPGDVAMGSSVMLAMPPATAFATAQIAVSFVRPASIETGRLTAHSTRVHVSPALALSDLVVEDPHGRLLAHGTSRQVVFPPVSPAPVPLAEWPLFPAEPFDTPDPYLRPPQGAVLPQEIWDTRSGLEITRDICSGVLPPAPIVELIGWEGFDVEEGHVRARIPSSEWFASAARTVYGGLLALFADMVLGCAVGTTLPPRASLATLDLSVNFLRPVFPDGRPLLAEARVTHRGRSIAVADVRIDNADGKPVVAAKSTSMILEDRPWTEAMSAASNHPAAEATT